MNLSRLFIISNFQNDISTNEALNFFINAVNGGAKFLGIRMPFADEDTVYNICQKLLKIIDNNNVEIAVFNHYNIAKDLKIGIHASAKKMDLREVDNTKVKFIGVSCHDAYSIQVANKINADYITLSPVFDSISKNGYKGLGVDDIYNMSKLFNGNVYSLGGINNKNYLKVKTYGYCTCGYIPNNFKYDEEFIF